MARPEKEQEVSYIAERFSSASSIYLTDFSGLNVEQIGQLRRQLRDADVEYRVVKNTLARLSAEKADRQDLLSYLQGPTAIAFGADDPVAPVKIITEFSKKTEKPTIRAGVLEGRLLQESELAEVAKLPSREVMLARFLGGLNAPIAGLAFALKGTISKLVYALNAIVEQKDDQSS